MREQIGTVTITRRRIYQLDPWALETPTTATVVVEPGEYLVYQDGFTRYWRMTGFLNTQTQRLGDGIFAMGPADAPGEDDVVFYSKRFGPDEWTDLVDGLGGETNPALVFHLTV